MANVKQLARAKWQSSGINDKIAKKLGYKAVIASSLGANHHAVGALHIPYFDLDGKRTKFYRVRYLEKLPGAAGVVEKPQRYDQPPVMQEAYFPPILDRTWREVAAEDCPIFITEGELKAACASACGFPTLALGGVYSFMSSKRGIDFLPALKEFNWKDREVYIVYDNDLVDNVEVLRAQLVLSQRLLAAGARAQYINLPPGPEKGLDDFLAKYGPEKFGALIGHAAPFAESTALWQMNSEVVLVKRLDLVVERNTDLLMYPDQFVRHLYSNRFFMEQIERGSGKNKHFVMEKAPLAARWMEWEQRAELWDLSYDPGKPKVVDGKTWNTWGGWGAKPKKGSVEPWTWLLDFLFANDKKARRYFEQWCAFPIQNPGAKMFTACVLWSRVKRMGKSRVGDALRGIYGENSVVVDAKQLKGNFNSWAKNRQLVIGEEITTGETRVDADYLKHVITTPVITVNEKNKPQYDIANHINFLLNSNHPDAVRMEDGDKRYMIHCIPHPYPADREKYIWYSNWLDNGGSSYLMDHFLRMRLTGFDPHEHAPETTSKSEMIIASKDDVSLWVLKLKEDAVNALKPLGAVPSQECDLYTVDQLWHAFDPQDRARGARGTLTSLGRSLVAAGYRQLNGGKPIGTASGIHRLYAVRNQEVWEQCPRIEIREHYDKFFGPKKQGGVK